MEQYFSYYVPQNSLITNFLQNVFLCVQNKHIHTGLDLLKDRIIIFGCTVPLRLLMFSRVTHVSQHIRWKHRRRLMIKTERFHWFCVGKHLFFRSFEQHTCWCEPGLLARRPNITGLLKC